MVVAMTVSRCSPLRFREDADAKEEETRSEAGGSEEGSPTQTSPPTRRTTATDATHEQLVHEDESTRRLVVSPLIGRGRTPRGYGTIATRGSLQVCF